MATLTLTTNQLHSTNRKAQNLGLDFDYTKVALDGYKYDLTFSSNHEYELFYKIFCLDGRTLNAFIYQSNKVIANEKSKNRSTVFTNNTKFNTKLKNMGSGGVGQIVVTKTEIAIQLTCGKGSGNKANVSFLSL